VFLFASICALILLVFSTEMVVASVTHRSRPLASELWPRAVHGASGDSIRARGLSRLGRATHLWARNSLASSLVINEIDYDQPGTDLAEFIELKNTGSTAINLDPFVLELVDGDGGGALVYQALDLPDFSLAPDAYYVICTDAAQVANCDLESITWIENGVPDAVALVLDGAIFDAVSYGGDTAGGYTEGSGEGLLDNGSLGNEYASIARYPDGVDTGVNNADFSLRCITPGTQNAGDQPPCAPPPGACGDPATRIHTIQGNGSASPMDGERGVVVEGIVVGDFQDPVTELSGFFLQEEDTDVDASAQTSEGIFVYDDGLGIDVHPGDLVRVQGDVTEFSGLTELANVRSVVTCADNMTVTRTPLLLPVGTVADLEWYEGMLVVYSQQLHATQTDNLGRFGEVWVSAGSRLSQPTNVVAPGAAATTRQDLNDRSRLLIDDGSDVQNPAQVPYLAAEGALSAMTLRLGDRVASLTGVLSQGFGNYRLQPTAPLTFVRSNARPDPPQGAGQAVTAASLNVYNYFNGDGQGGGFPTSRGADTPVEFSRQRDKLIGAVLALDADVVGLQEIENDGYDEGSAIHDLVAGLNACVQKGHAASPGTYAYIDPGVARIGSDEIAVGLIYRPARLVPAGPAAILDSGVDPLFRDDKNRPALAQTFEDTGTGARFTVAVNHFKSKGSSCADIGDPDAGDGQGNCNGTRTDAAVALANWLAMDPTGSADRDVLIIGDLNAYAREDPIVALEQAAYVDLIEAFAGTEAYSYVYDGQAGYLDHALASPSLLDQVTGAMIWHINADEPAVLDYNDDVQTAGEGSDSINPAYLYHPDPFRSADHDPLLVYLDLVPPAPQLSIAKSVATLHTPVGLGDPVTYTISVLNQGDLDAEGVTMTDTLPVGLVGDDLYWTGAVLAGHGVEFTIPAVVTTNVAFYEQIIANTAFFSHTSGRGSSSVAITLEDAPPRPRLSVVKSVEPAAEVEPGGTLTYTILVTNEGELAAPNVVLTDVLPAEAEFATWIISPAGTQVAGKTVYWQGEVGAGKAVTWAFTTKVSGILGARVINTATLTYEDERLEDGIAFRFTRAPVHGIVINEILKDPAAVADEVGEWLELHNAGDLAVDLDGCRLMDNDTNSHAVENGGQLIIEPGGYLILGRHEAVSENGGVELDYAYRGFELANGADEVILTCDGRELDRVEYDDGQSFPDPTGASLELADPALDNNRGENWCNAMAAWAGSAGDRGTPGSANDCAAASPLNISKSVTPIAGVALGDTITYTVALANVIWNGIPANDGEGVAPNVALTDRLPAEVSFGQWLRAPGGTNIASNVITWGGELEAGELLTWTFTARLEEQSAGTVVNTATVEYEGAQIDARAGFAPQRDSVTDIVIHEVMKDPAAVADAQGEWLELYNVGEQAANLAGCWLKDDGADAHQIEEGQPLVIEPGGYLVLGRNGALAENGGVSVGYEYSGFILANDADEVILECDGREVDRVAYDAGLTFPDPTGASMQLVDSALDNNLGENWCQATGPWPGSAGDRGTPGAANDCRAVGALSVAKTVEPATGVAPGATVTYTIAVANLGNSPVTGITLSDPLPPEADFGTWILAPGGTAVGNDRIAWQGNLGAGEAITWAFTAQISATQGTLVTNTASVEHASGQVEAAAALSLERESRSRLVTQVIINEIMMDPDAVFDVAGEWLELFNAGQRAVDLNGCELRDDGTNLHQISQAGPLLIEPGGYLVLGRNGDRAENGGVPVDYTYTGYLLANDDDEVVLVCDGGEVDRVAYDGGLTFPDPTGASIQLAHPSLDNSVGGNWCEARTMWPGSAGDRGTPGQANDCPASPVLTVTKTLSTTQNPVRLGAPLTYTIAVSNSGPIDAFGLVVTDTLPAGIIGPDLAWTGNVSAGASVRFGITAVVTTDVAYCGRSITNTAWLSHGSGRGSDSAALTVHCVESIYLPLIERATFTGTATSRP
jgi:uncharacterized repeat protein (TIGR01451 family)